MFLAPLGDPPGGIFPKLGLFLGLVVFHVGGMVVFFGWYGLVVWWYFGGMGWWYGGIILVVCLDGMVVFLLWSGGI